MRIIVNGALGRMGSEVIAAIERGFGDAGLRVQRIRFPRGNLFRAGSKRHARLPISGKAQTA